MCRKAQVYFGIANISLLAIGLTLVGCKNRVSSKVASLYEEDSSDKRRRVATDDEISRIGSMSNATVFFIDPHLIMTNLHVSQTNKEITFGPTKQAGKYSNDIQILEKIESSENLDYAIYRIRWQKGYKFLIPEKKPTQGKQQDSGVATAPPRPPTPIHEVFDSLAIEGWGSNDSYNLWKKIQRQRNYFKSSKEEHDFVFNELKEAGLSESQRGFDVAFKGIAAFFPKTQEAIRKTMEEVRSKAQESKPVPKNINIIKCLAKRGDLKFGESFDTGTQIFTTGYPYDLKETGLPTTSFGSVRAIPDNDIYHADTRMSLRFDIGIVGGNSGGPLLTVKGKELVGIATFSNTNKAEIVKSQEPININGGAGIWQIYNVSPTLQKLFPKPSFCKN